MKKTNTELVKENEVLRLNLHTCIVTMIIMFFAIVILALRIDGII